MKSLNDSSSSVTLNGSSDAVSQTKTLNATTSSTQQAPVQHYGVTEPISILFPTPNDIRLSLELENTLKEFGLFDTPEESRKREEVLGKLNQIVLEWAKQVSLKRGFTEQMASEVIAKIFTFGSYRLGVHGSGSDIDTLCVGPKHIMRSDFFEDLSEILKVHPEITEFSAVKDAYVPVMKMVFSGVQIDLLFARLALSAIPEELNDLIDESYLKNLDDKSILSLNGCRVADQVLRLVPNIVNFRMALRCIKLWAKKRAIYSNVLGLLGGISYALLTARICQLYPNASPSTLIHRFFKVYENWKWPAPVVLNHIQEGGIFAAKVWNQKKDKSHLMPIITPAYPCMNSTYNVSKSTLTLLKSEFVRGAEVTRKIEKGESNWSELFEKSDFFTRFRFYLQIDCVSANDEEHIKWEGWVESKLRLLILGLESTINMKNAFPYPKCFENKEIKTIPEGFKCTSFFMGLAFNFSGTDKSVDLTKAVAEFTSIIKSLESKSPTMDMKVHYINKKSLPTFVRDESPPEKKVTKKRNIANISTATPTTNTTNTVTSPDPSNKKLKSKTTPNTTIDLQPTTTTTTTTLSEDQTQPINNNENIDITSPTINQPPSSTTNLQQIESITNETNNTMDTTTITPNLTHSPTTSLKSSSSEIVPNESMSLDHDTIQPTKKIVVNTLEVNELDFIGSSSTSGSAKPIKKPAINMIRG